MSNRNQKVGVWLVGACGGVGSTVALGLAALRRKRCPPTGMVTTLPPFRHAGMVDPATLVLGGHEVRAESLIRAVDALHTQAGLFDARLVRDCAAALRAMHQNIRPGTLCGTTSTIDRIVRESGKRPGAVKDRTPARAVERLRADIEDFQERNKLASVVVVYIASSQPPLSAKETGVTWATLRRRLNRPGGDCPTPAIYALAALEAGCPFVNFTPSPALAISGVRERADALGLPYMGNDGKTGETLIKSALAPMFASRNLKILSWFGQNLLGNRDGEALSDPDTRAAKIKTKDSVVASIVGGRPNTKVSIEQVPSLGDWKVAWDHIHFEGFLQTKMNMQFTWQGSDSVLAAPLIIDLVRLAALEHRVGRGGPMRHLAFFFKDPIGVSGHDLASQWQRLTAHVAADASKR